ncbi:hypothetical protein C8Q70DRAFT_904467 [Cubamyces menziesii]|nr:hypothetical protein C8Q70DRAFT_904467 [Cubamyces menziesii]
MSSTIDLLDDAEALSEWKDTDWIMQNKKYPAVDTPPPVLAARRQVLAIPPDQASLLPAPHIPVSQLLRLDLPSQPARLTFEKASKAFSQELPTDTLVGITWSRPIPPPPFLKDLESAFGQAWFDGAQSIVDSRYKQSRLPLHALTYWSEMSMTLMKKATWRKAVVWLDKLDEKFVSTGLSQRARGFMDTLAWGEDLRVLGAATTTDALARLLSDQWLDDEAVDMLTTNLANRVLANPELSCNTIVTTLAFQHCVMATYVHGRPIEQDSMLHALKARLDDGQKKRLFFPINVDNNHWVAFCVNFLPLNSKTKPSRTIRELVKALQAWLKGEFDAVFRCNGNAIPHGIQQDSSSCGVCTINTLAHNIFDAPLFHQSKARSLRVEYFSILAQAHLDNASNFTWKRKTTHTRRASTTSFDEPHPQQSLASIDDIPAPSTAPTDSSSDESKDEGTECSTDESDTDSDGHIIDTRPKGRQNDSRIAGPVGISRSAQDAAQINVSLQNGSFNINKKKLDRFLKKLAALDRAAEVREFGKRRRWQVWHSRCAKWKYMKGPYSTTRFREHVTKCNAHASDDNALVTHMVQEGGRESLSRLGIAWVEWYNGQEAVEPGGREQRRDVRGRQHHESNRPNVHLSVSSHTERPSSVSDSNTLPCTGINERVDERIPLYLRRAFTDGGGSTTVGALSEQRYGRPYKELSQAEKTIIDDIQVQRRTWRNDIHATVVRSVTCERFVDASLVNADQPALCGKCSDVLDSQPFKNTLRKAVYRASEKFHYKHLNSKYRSETLAHLFSHSRGLESILMTEDPDATAYARLAAGLANGALSGYPVVGNMMSALAELMDREERGVGRQNFQYGPSLVEFANMCAIISPELYRLLAQHFPLPTIRHLKKTQNVAPKFPLSVCSDTFTIVDDYLRKLHYQGKPVGLSCDDTKLHPSFRTYWDAEKECHMLVGGTDEPRAVANVEELQRLLHDPSIAKATKLRLWCLQIPLPKVPPIVVAARAIPNSLSVADLHALIKPLLKGLLERGVAVCSYACDGTETERALQNLLIQDADHHITHIIPHPLGADHPPLTVEIAVYNGQPIVMIQDSKHALKTFRNNLFSGARLLILGNDVAMYGWARLLAFLEDSPLFNRDIEKLDRQDDNAATRLFSATTLEYLTQKHPERAAMVVYLFVLGELVDAYQNRHISHLERVKMVLRARYFLDTWRAYLKAAGYSESRHFISREAADIALCEHVFAECRKLVKDFTHLDFLYMIPRLHVLLRSIIKFSHTTEAKARAAGYAHSYFDTDDIDLAQLAQFPTDAEIAAAAHDAWEETESLFSLVGIVPADFLTPAHATLNGPPGTLPSISSWYAPDASLSTSQPSPAVTPPSNHVQTAWLSDESDISSDEETEGNNMDDCNEAAQLEGLIGAHEHTWSERDDRADEQFLNLTCAAAALAMNDTVIAQNAASHVLDAELAQYEEEDRLEIQMAFEAASSKLLGCLPAEPTRAFDRPLFSAENIDYSPINNIRQAHGTRRAAQSVRMGQRSNGTSEPDSKSTAAPSSESARRLLIRQMEDVIRQQQSGQGIGMGLERSARWTNAPPNGNSLNATLSAGQRAATVLKRRLKVFAQHRVPDSSQVADALIGKPTQGSLHSLLGPDTYGLVFLESRLLVGRVLAVYSRDGGKNGKHSWRPSVDHIGLVSYVAIQVYEPIHSTQFRAILRRMAPYQTFTFALISADLFLRVLPGEHTLSADRRTLTLDTSVLDALQRLQQPTTLTNLSLAIKELGKLRRKSGQAADEDLGN